MYKILFPVSPCRSRVFHAKGNINPQYFKVVRVCPGGGRGGLEEALSSPAREKVPSYLQSSKAYPEMAAIPRTLSSMSHPSEQRTSTNLSPFIKSLNAKTKCNTHFMQKNVWTFLNLLFYCSILLIYLCEFHA